VGGGLGVAIAYPQAKALWSAGARVDLIVGFRNKSLIIMERSLRAACTNLIVMTDDGSGGRGGFVTDALNGLLSANAGYDLVVAIGPLGMMKAVSEMTRPYGIKTVVSMNSVMIDGTGMCGCCRVRVGGQMKFACVDGPDFDGHLVDYDSAAVRSRIFLEEEKRAMERHTCRLTGEVRADA
jgi:ferredoxin--NADP+ reductase